MRYIILSYFLFYQVKLYSTEMGSFCQKQLRSPAAYKELLTEGSNAEIWVRRSTDPTTQKFTLIKKPLDVLSVVPDDFALAVKSIENEARILSILNPEHKDERYPSFWGFVKAEKPQSGAKLGGVVGTTVDNLNQFLPYKTFPEMVESKFSMAKALIKTVMDSHQKNIIHGDLNGSNAVMMPDGRAGLIDFGMAHINGEKFSLKFEDSMINAYRAPGLVRERNNYIMTPYVDIYSLGTLFRDTFQSVGNYIQGKGAQENKRRLREINARLDKQVFSPMSTADPSQQISLAEALERLEALEKSVSSP